MKKINVFSTSLETILKKLFIKIYWTLKIAQKNNFFMEKEIFSF